MEGRDEEGEGKQQENKVQNDLKIDSNAMWASLSTLQLAFRQTTLHSSGSKNVFNRRFFELKQNALELEAYFLKEKKSIVVVIGRNGVGKTHVINEILETSKPSDKEYQIVSHKKHEKSSIEVYSIPNPYNFWSQFTSDEILKYFKIEMKQTDLMTIFLSKSAATILDDSFYLLPENESSACTKVPYRIVYGAELRCTIVFEQVSTINTLLDSLKSAIKVSRIELEDDKSGKEKRCSDEKMHSSSTAKLKNRLHLQKALSILGLDPNIDLTEVRERDICIPKEVRDFLSTCVSFVPREYNTFAQQICQMKDFICRSNCVSKLSHAIGYFVIQYPSKFFKNGLELIDTPGFNSVRFSDRACDGIYDDLIKSASNLIYVCDERKLDDEFRSMMLKYDIVEKFCKEDRKVFILNNCREQHSLGFVSNLVSLRCNELKSLDFNLSCGKKTKLYAGFFKGCGVFTHSRYLKDQILELSLKKLLETVSRPYCIYPFNLDDVLRIGTLLTDLINYSKYSTQMVLHVSQKSYDYFENEMMDILIIVDKVIVANFNSFLDKVFMDQLLEVSQIENIKFCHKHITLDICTNFGMKFGAKPTKIAQYINKSIQENILKFYHAASCRSEFDESVRLVVMRMFNHLEEIFLDLVLPLVYQESSRFQGNNAMLILQNYITSFFEKVSNEIMLSEKLWGTFKDALITNVKQKKDFCAHFDNFSLNMVCMDDVVHRSIINVMYFSSSGLRQLSQIPERYTKLCRKCFKIAIENFESDFERFVLDAILLAFEYLPVARNIRKVLSFDLFASDTVCNEYCHELWNPSEYKTLFLELPKLLESHFDTRALIQMCEHLWKTASLNSLRKRSMASIRNRIICAYHLFGVDANIYKWVSSILIRAAACKKVSKTLTLKKMSNKREVPDLTSLFFCRRKHAVLDGLSFIISKLNDHDFFNEWGSDFLVTLYFFMEISHDETIISICKENLNGAAEKWHALNSSVPNFCGSEDIKFLLEGIFILYKLTVQHLKLRKQTYSHINKLRLSTFLCSNKLKIFSTYHKINTKELNEDIVWSFFFRENGVHVENGSEFDVDNNCLSNVGSLQFCKLENKMFREHSYFVTHIIFTKSEWCQFSLFPDEWVNEISFMKFNLPTYIWMRDVEITGEFVQALKCTGVPESDADMKDALDFLINTQHDDGSWLQREGSDRRYHATVCALGALFDHFYKGIRHKIAV